LVFSERGDGSSSACVTWVVVEEVNIPAPNGPRIEHGQAFENWCALMWTALNFA
jgi:hypothetical protein